MKTTCLPHPTTLLLWAFHHTQDAKFFSFTLRLLHHARRQPSAPDITMPDSRNTGWRKKIHGKTKEPLQIVVPVIATPPATDSIDKKKHHGWRRTLPGSRPSTPVGALASTPTSEDGEEQHHERGEHQILHRQSRPRLSRYTSLFGTFNNSTKEPQFVRPWTDNAAPSLQAWVDPLDAVQRTLSHMTRYSTTPIPMDHNIGLFRAFEDYRNVRNRNEDLELALHDTNQAWEQDQQQWTEEEQQYKAEIRRLELIIAQSSKGISG